MAEPTFYDKITGKRHGDIALPNQSGKTDPRLAGLGGSLKDVGESLRQAVKGRAAGGGSEALKALREAMQPGK